MCPFVSSKVFSSAFPLQGTNRDTVKRVEKMLSKDLSAPVGFQSRPELAELASALWSSSLGVAAVRHPWHC